MRFGLERNHRLDIVNVKETGRIGLRRRELFYHRPFDKGHVVLVGRYELVGILGRGLLDQLEKGTFLLYPIDDEHAVENLVAAMLGIDLGEAEHLAVGERTADLGAKLLEVFDFVRVQSQAFFLVVGFDILDVTDRVRLLVHLEHGIVNPVVEPLQHLVIACIGPTDREEFLNPAYALDAHVLSDFHRISAPRGYHLLARAHEPAAQGTGIQKDGLVKKPD